MRIALITGSGTYALPALESSSRRAIATRCGDVEITEGSIDGTQIVHVARHLQGHRRLSSQVTHRANALALRELAVDGILAGTACGSLDAQLAPGELVVFDDLHFLSNRLPDGSLCTLHTEEGGAGRGHWVFDRPFSPPLRDALLQGALDAGHGARDGGCYGHVDGPRFNSRTEIRALQQAGVCAVSQTAAPEAVLAGEAGIPYALIGFVTDYANGVCPDSPTPLDELDALIGRSSAVFAATLRAALARIDAAALAPVGRSLGWD